MCFAIVLGTALCQTRAMDDQAAIKAVLDAHAAAWTEGDAHAATGVLTEDADWLLNSGMLRGKASIEAWHRDRLNGSAKNTRHVHPGTPDIRFIRPDVAIVDGNTWVGAKDAEPSPASIGRFTAIFVKDGGHWKVTAFRPWPKITTQ
jgi:uncharacterized protein (TIGR02246 family)